MSSDSTDNDQNQHQSIGSSVAEETTRIEAVHYLEGASGHGVLSFLLVLIAAVLHQQDMFGTAVVAVVVAYGIAINGLSIFLWDELRVYFGAMFEQDTEQTATRTLTPHSISTEMKAEVLSGATMVGGFVVVLTGALGLLRIYSPERTVMFAIASLAFGNVVALGWSYLRS